MIAPLVHGVDAVTASTAIPARNIELDEAGTIGVTVLTRAGMLASICAQARSLGGRRHARQDDDHVDADADPGRGRAAAEFRRSAATSPTWAPGRSGPDRRWFVVEADESDGTHLELPLYGTILTNVEVDHLDHYGTFDGIVDGLRPVPRSDRRSEGGVRRRPDRRRPRRHATVRSPTGCAEGVDSRAVDVTPIDGRVHGSPSSGRSASTPDGSSARSTLPLRGVHNVVNATGAAAMAMSVGVEFDARRAAPRPVRRCRPPVRHPWHRRWRHLRRRLRPPSERDRRGAGRRPWQR